MKKVKYGVVMISERELVKSSKNLPLNQIGHIGKSALIAFSQNRKDIVEHGLFVPNIKTNGSDSVFFFLRLPDGSVSMGKIKGKDKIFDRISV